MDDDADPRAQYRKSQDYLGRKLMNSEMAQAYALVAVAEALHRLADAAEVIARSAVRAER